MVKIILVAREPGTVTVDFSLEFEVPEVPRQGDYISVQRPDIRASFGEDFIVQQVWWRLRHTESHGYASTAKPGDLVEIFVECDPAISPYSSESWRESLRSAHQQGHVQEFKVSRRTLGSP